MERKINKVGEGKRGEEKGGRHGPSLSWARGLSPMNCSLSEKKIDIIISRTTYIAAFCAQQTTTSKLLRQNAQVSTKMRLFDSK